MKRYMPDMNGEMEPCGLGDWVLYSDVDLLEESLADIGQIAFTQCEDPQQALQLIRDRLQSSTAKAVRSEDGRIVGFQE